MKIFAFSFPHFKCIILINYHIHWRMLCQNTMAVRVRAAASPSHFRMTSWSAPTAARLITASATRSWASASTAPPTPPATSGSSPTRRASSAPVRPAASAPCGTRKRAAAAVLCCPPRGRSLLLPAAAVKRLSTTPRCTVSSALPLTRRRSFLRTPSAKRPRWTASTVRTGWTISALPLPLTSPLTAGCSSRRAKYP